MTFGVSMYNVSWVRSYADAVDMYNKATAWRGEDPDGERPLPDKRDRNYGVRMDGTDVVFRMHWTDVVTWHKDGSYTVNNGGYHTNSTCAFSNNFMPIGVYLMKRATVLRINNTMYPIAGHRVTVSPDGTVSGEGLGRFERRTINRKNSKKLREDSNFLAYRAWHALMFPMVKDTLPPMWQRRYIPTDHIEAHIKDEEKWHDVMVSNGGQPNQVLAMLYAYLGRDYGIWGYKYEPTLTGYDIGKWEVTGA